MLHWISRKVPACRFTSSIFDRQMEMDEALGSLKEKFERERSLLTEENRKLTSETDRVRGNKGFFLYPRVMVLRRFWSGLSTDPWFLYQFSPAMHICGQTNNPEQTAGGRVSGLGLKEGECCTLGGTDRWDHSVVRKLYTRHLLFYLYSRLKLSTCNYICIMSAKSWKCAYYVGLYVFVMQGEWWEGCTWLPASASLEDDWGARVTAQLQPGIQTSGTTSFLLHFSNLALFRLSATCT